MKLISKKILLTCGRSYITLDLARNLRDSGCEVYVAETSKRHVCYYSNAVTKNFVVTGPHVSSEAFINELVAIVNENQIDMVIPIWEEIFYISQALSRFPPSCTVFCMPFATLDILHNKWKFIDWLKQHKFLVPETVLIQNTEQLKTISFKKPYALKPCYCRASQHIYKISEGKAFPEIQLSPKNPWIAQEWIEGNRYCSYSICHQGRLNAVSLYPVDFAINGTSCITFRPVSHTKIFIWIEKCVRELNYTGQIGFDFIEKPNGDLYVVDCNPRATCGLHLFDAKDHIADAFLDKNQSTIYPRPSMQKQVATGMLLYGWKNQTHLPNFSYSHFFKTLTSTPDVVFSAADPKPFFMMPVLFTGYWCSSLQQKKPMHACFYSDVEWNNE